MSLKLRKNISMGLLVKNYPTYYQPYIIFWDWDWHVPPTFFTKNLSECSIYMHSKPMEMFFLNFKDIYKMTKKMLQNCMFWDACHRTREGESKMSQSMIQKILVINFIYCLSFILHLVFGVLSKSNSIKFLLNCVSELNSPSLLNSKRPSSMSSLNISWSLHIFQFWNLVSFY